MQVNTSRRRSTQIRRIGFLLFFILTVTLGGLYTSNNTVFAGDDQHEDGTVPEASLGVISVPSGEVRGSATFTTSVNITNTPWIATFGVTTTFPIPVVPEDVIVTAGGSQPGAAGALAATAIISEVIIEGQTVTWFGELPANSGNQSLTIEYLTRLSVEKCSPANEKDKPIDAQRQTEVVTNTTTLQELTESSDPSRPNVPSQVIRDESTYTVALLPCVITMPLVRAVEVPFPALQNGDLSQGPGVGWRQLVNGQNGTLIYPRSDVPTGVQAGNLSAYIAWLGGARNQTNTLEQSVFLNEGYPASLRFRYFTTSAETACERDTAKVYILNSQGTVLTQLSFNLCSGSGNATNAWTDGKINLEAMKGKSVTLRFESVLNDSINSNWFLSNFELCSNTKELPAGAPAGTPVCP